MAISFSHLLKKPAGQAKKPQALPPGIYPGIIKNWSVGDQNKNKTPYVRFGLALTGWDANVADDDKMQEGVDGKKTYVDLSKRNISSDFYLTDDPGSWWRLDEFLRALELDLEGNEYETVLPNVIGRQVLVEIEQYLDAQNEFRNRAKSLKVAS